MRLKRDKVARKSAIIDLIERNISVAEKLDFFGLDILGLNEFFLEILISKLTSEYLKIILEYLKIILMCIHEYCRTI